MNPSLFARYFVSGGAGAATNLAVLYVLADTAGVYYLTAATLAFLSGIIVGFSFQKFWTFRDAHWGTLPRQFIFYGAVSTANLFLNIALLYLFVERAHLWYIYAQALAIVILNSISYLIHRHITFREYR